MIGIPPELKNQYQTQQSSYGHDAYQRDWKPLAPTVPSKEPHPIIGALILAAVILAFTASMFLLDAIINPKTAVYHSVQRGLDADINNKQHTATGNPRELRPNMPGLTSASLTEPPEGFYIDPLILSGVLEAQHE